jgi:flagellar biosynthesis anti-sigma factor FlgM
MRIPDGYGKSTEIAGPSTAKSSASQQAGAPATSSSSPGGGGGEKVTVSATAQRAAAKAESTKIDQLRSAVESGTLKIDTKAIASRIVDGA